MDEISSAQTSARTPDRNVADKLKSELPDHEVLEHLGSGGNADVHKVRLDRTGELLALKVPQWQGTLSKSVVEDFIEEAQTWSQLDSHEHIIDIHDYGGTPYPWMLLEFMDSGTLADRLGATSLDEGLETLIDVCEATHHAHQHGIAHTDLKPENIMFVREGAEDVVKVGDWGLAAVMLEHSKSIEGMTPHYSAPEQIDPDTYGGTGPATDIYQLGVIGYEIVTGSTPFVYDSQAAVMNAIISKEPDAPSTRGQDIPSDADHILQRALAKEQSERYESVLYLRDEIQNLQDSL